MSPRSSAVIILLLVSVCFVSSSLAGWKKIAVIPLVEGEVQCGFFFDELTGLVGTGNWTSGNFFIRRTTDGGKTWTVSTTPVSKGEVTSIFMKDALTGYATVGGDAVSQNSILKTTDGGITWADDSHSNEATGTCVYATSRSLVRTDWYRDDVGQFSLDDGLSFTGITSEPDTYGNGIDFADDLNGVVVYYGENTADRSFPSFITQDGGVTWSQGDSLPEAWSVYALKGTKTFITLPEGQQSFPSHTVYWSQNGGLNWSVRAVLPNAGFTGHIGGVGNTIYVQSLAGFYRSDDLGLTWKFVAGPANGRDTRFVVTGCKGQVVYAFDNAGFIYKTTDGGDGTLTASSSSNILLGLTEDSLYMEAHFCQPVRTYFHISNATCNSVVTIDSVTFTPNPYNEFSVDTAIAGVALQSSVNGFGIPIVFRSDSDAVRKTLVRIVAHSGGQTIDTTILLVARQLLAPDPYVGVPAPAKVGSTALIPVYLHPTQDSFQIMHYAFHLSFDEDVLAPEITPFDASGTLSAGAVVQVKTPAGGVYFTVDFAAPITEASDLTKPLIYVRTYVYLSRHLYCDIRLDSFSYAGGAGPLAPLEICGKPHALFLVDKVCADTTISSFLLTGNAPTFISVHPNPNNGISIEAQIHLSLENDLKMEIIDAEGKSAGMIFDQQHFTEGDHTVHINTSSLASGVYILRMSAHDGSVAQQQIIIDR
jgi:photosystem II stability/assembly factor-like uncharacterized protein